MHLDRNWLCNLLYSVNEAALDAHIKESVKKRKDKEAEKHKLEIEILPEFASALKTSLSFSSKPAAVTLTCRELQGQGDVIPQGRGPQEAEALRDELSGW